MDRRIDNLHILWTVFTMRIVDMEKIFCGYNRGFIFLRFKWSFKIIYI